MAEIQDSGSESNLRYQRFRPDRYSPEMSIFWWIRKKPFVHFISRELTSIFVAAYAIILIVQLRALSRGAEAWEGLLEWLSTPFSIGLHVVILLAVLFHSITWFNLAPSAMVVKMGKKRIPGVAIITLNYLMWIVLSGAVAWIVLTA
ncbi:MAG: hypothetical protein R3224_05065 [Balneolaceae bacterium]|nr:hypothetical protein [Balneolaceae bacterium]